MSGPDVDALVETVKHSLLYLASQSEASEIDGDLPERTGIAALARSAAEMESGLRGLAAADGIQRPTFKYPWLVARYLLPDQAVARSREQQEPQA